MYYIYIRGKKVRSKGLANQLIKGMETILGTQIKGIILYFLCISYLEAQA